MGYFFGFLLLCAGIIMAFFGINNVESTEALTILNTMMILCAICAIGFSGVLFVLGSYCTNKKQNYEDDNKDI